MPFVQLASAPSAPARPLSGSVLLLALAVSLGGLGGFFWWFGVYTPLAYWQIGCLVAGLLVLNMAPLLVELIGRTFDPFDPKHIFLSYFFLIFTFRSLCQIFLGVGTNPLLTITPQPDPDLRVRALCSMLVALAAFVAGCYLPVGRLLGQAVPKLSPLKRRRALLVALGGIGIGLLAFGLLMRSAGGVGAFLEGLGTWRTNGVIAGIGYLTFPIAFVLPASVLLLLLQYLPAAPQKLTWKSLTTIVLYLGSLTPVLLLGFRASLVPAILQFLAAWHYGRRRLRASAVGILAATLFLLLSAYGAVRHVVEGGDSETKSEAMASAVLFRVPSLDTVERVIWRLDQGEPHRGVLPGAKEAATILMPRSIWPSKPEAASLAFADIFFFDFFLGRGDSLDGIRSGISPTLVGEMLWVGGLPGVVLFAWVLGTLSATINTWRKRDAGHPIHVWVVAILVGYFALFVEAPQNTLNVFAMFAAFCGCVCWFLTLRVRCSPLGHENQNWHPAARSAGDPG